MNFKDWREKYYPEVTDEDTLSMMSHAYAAGHVNMAAIHNGGVGLIAAERHRHFEVEGWDIGHDAEHDPGTLALAGVCYAIHTVTALQIEHGLSSAEMLQEQIGFIDLRWPWGEKWWKPTPNDLTRQLVKAGSLIAAEIDKIKAS